MFVGRNLPHCPSITGVGPERTAQIAVKVAAFVREVVIPFEQNSRRDGHEPAEELVDELRPLARRAGVLTPHIPSNGVELNIRESASVFRNSGLSPLGPHACDTESSMSKVAVSDALFRVADRCVQVMGGSGVSRDTIVETVFPEMRALRIYDGPTEVHKWSLAKKIKRDELAGGAA